MNLIPLRTFILGLVALHAADSANKLAKKHGQSQRYGLIILGFVDFIVGCGMVWWGYCYGFTF